MGGYLYGIPWLDLLIRYPFSSPSNDHQSNMSFYLPFIPQATGGGGAAAKKPKPDTSTINLEAEAKAKRVRMDENSMFDTWMPEWSGHHSANNILKRISLSETFHILIRISLKFVPEGLLTMNQHNFSYQLGTEKLTNHYLNECWPISPNPYGLRPGTPVLEVIFNKYLIFEFSTGNSFLILSL